MSGADDGAANPVGAPGEPIVRPAPSVLDRPALPGGKALTSELEGTMLRPLPPFRTEPSRKPLQPKRLSDNRKEGAPVAVKAKRHPIKVARLATAPSLKILSTAALSP
jgi:hypothetical protein